MFYRSKNKIFPIPFQIRLQVALPSIKSKQPFLSFISALCECARLIQIEIMFEYIELLMAHAEWTLVNNRSLRENGKRLMAFYWKGPSEKQHARSTLQSSSNKGRPVQILIARLAANRILSAANKRWKCEFCGCSSERQSVEKRHWHHLSSSISSRGGRRSWKGKLMRKLNWFLSLIYFVLREGSQRNLLPNTKLSSSLQMISLPLLSIFFRRHVHNFFSFFHPSSLSLSLLNINFKLHKKILIIIRASEHYAWYRRSLRREENQNLQG